MTRWGILSTGRIAAKFVEDLRLLPDAEIVAVGSRTIGNAREFASRHRIGRAYGSWKELAADPDVDVVYVATPHAAHHEATMTCLTAGKAVLCEKPFTLDRASAAELIEAARTSGVFLMEGMWMRCNPNIRRMAELVADGAIGTVTSVHADFGLGGSFSPEHRLRARALGGGALLDLGVYPVSLAHLLLEAPDEIRAWGTLGPEGTDENTAIILGYRCGAFASLSCGIVGATRCGASITGTRGRIELPSHFHAPRRFTLHRASTEPEVMSAEMRGSGFEYEAAEVQRCLAAGLVESPLVPHAVTLEVMGLLDTVRQQIGVTYP